jgi:hypothetical protein
MRTLRHQHYRYFQYRIFSLVIDCEVVEGADAEAASASTDAGNNPHPDLIDNLVENNQLRYT